MGNECIYVSQPNQCNIAQGVDLFCELCEDIINGNAGDNILP